MLDTNTKIGVALAGGGLQGFSHIGALKALEELGINIDYISGTSTGSVAATLYAIGYSPNEIQNICEQSYKNLSTMKKGRLLTIGKNFLLHKETKVEGLIDGNTIKDFINKYAKQKNIDLITNIKNKKLAITTVDTKTMKECLFVSNLPNQYKDNINYITDINIGQAVQSSMAFPAIFTTVNYKDYNFIDGGTINNLPVEILKDMGATKTISISFDLYKYKPSSNLEGVILRALDIFSLQSVNRGKELSDVNIEVYNPNAALINIKDLKETIDNGYNAVMKNKELIKNTLCIEN